MAMLAEPRRKQKWTLNPRGKQWSEDSNKFGQKMLEKMGWSNGKGLGANEQGMTEHVKVNYKNNQSGIGFKDTNDQWTQHQADFNEFLSQLQEQNSNSENTATVAPDTGESLELKSKQSRARVHYHKFTRGKDVKKYSSKDLANIFGKKELGDATQLSKVEEAPLETVEEPTGSKDTTGGVLTIKGGNIDEYFRNKLPNFVKKGNPNVQVEKDDYDVEYRPHFGLGFSSVNGRDECSPSENGETVGEAVDSTSGFAFANEGMDVEYSEEGSEPKKRRVDFAYDNPCLNLENGKKRVEKCAVPFSREGFVNPALNLTESTNDANIGAEFEVSRVEFGVVNDALDLSDEEGKKKRVTFNDKLEYNTDVVKRKKGKAKAKLDKFEVESNDKLKKKSKESVAVNDVVSGGEVAGFVNEALDVEVINEEINDNELNERKTKKAKRKKKNRRESNLETIEEAAEECSVIYQSEIGEAVLLDEGSPRKKKKLEKSSKINSSNLEAEATIDSQDDRCEEERRMRKKEKKSKKKCTEVETEQEIVILEELVVLDKPKKGKRESENEKVEVTVAKEVAKKKKKSKSKKSDESIEAGDEEPTNNDPRFEVSESTEGKKKSKKKSKAKFEETEEADNRLDTTNTSSGVKRKSSDINEAEKSTKKSKVEDAENVEENGNTSVNSATSSLRNKKGRTPKKIFKSLFSKAPTLYFSGANINEMVGYGADFRDATK